MTRTARRMEIRFLFRTLQPSFWTVILIILTFFLASLFDGFSIGMLIPFPTDVLGMQGDDQVPERVRFTTIMNAERIIVPKDGGGTARQEGEFFLLSQSDRALMGRAKTTSCSRGPVAPCPHFSYPVESLIRMESGKYEPVSTLLLRTGRYFCAAPLASRKNNSRIFRRDFCSDPCFGNPLRIRDSSGFPKRGPGHKDPCKCGSYSCANP